ncbi:MAG: hypothetical protein J3T61_03155 [Candidatus Brocadiales bacterium]|nr:hypothetical protein [Candidatus Bathyanammoxibius sp.]
MQQPTTQTTSRQPTVAVPKVIPPRPAVSQATLAEILKRRREIKEAEKSLKALKHDLSMREQGVIKAIQSGATVSHGILAAEVRPEERRNVAWRKVAEQYLGHDFCELVAEETPPTVYARLLIA